MVTCTTAGSRGDGAISKRGRCSVRPQRDLNPLIPNPLTRRGLHRAWESSSRSGLSSITINARRHFLRQCERDHTLSVRTAGMILAFNLGGTVMPDSSRKDQHIQERGTRGHSMHPSGRRSGIHLARPGHEEAPASDYPAREGGISGRAEKPVIKGNPQSKKSGG
jgi:hypothetical protein